MFNAFESANIRKLKKYQMNNYFSGIYSKIVRNNKYYIDIYIE